MNAKKTILLACAFAAVFAAGAVSMRVWDAYHGACAANAALPVRSSDSFLTVDLRDASVPEGVTAADEADYAELKTPSQLSKINLPDVEKIISRSGQEVIPGENEPEEAPSAVDLSDVKEPASSAEAAEEPKSAISMIEAPVKARLIKNSREYKEFKRVARGSYPAADFAKQDVLVLESTSNLPDKVFEIQQVSEENGKRVVTYRVSVFGLDQKTNTHSAVLLQKRDLPLELKQVL